MAAADDIDGSTGGAAQATRKAGTRPAHVRPPAYLTPSPPVPKPAKPADGEEHGGRDGLDPVRYGDWEQKGIAVDF